MTFKEYEDGFEYAPYREEDRWYIDVSPPGENGFTMVFTTFEGMNQALEELTGEDYATFTAACGTPGLVG